MRLRGGGILLLPFIAGAIVGAAAGMIIWCILRALWFVLGVAPFRIVAGIRDGIYNNQLEDAMERMEQYVDGLDD
jgi:uncharacterized membrane protein YoaK (UPF0700 family)